MRTGATPPRRPILIVEDEPYLQKAIANNFRRLWPIVIAGTFDEGAREIRGETRFAAAIIDVRLPDGLGTDLLEIARSLQPGMRILVYTAFNDEDAIAATVRWGAEYGRKPFSLFGFVRRVVISEHVHDDLLARHIDAYTAGKDLSARQAEIVALVAADFCYEGVADQLGISVSTVRNHGQAIADRCGLTLGEIALRLRDAVRGEREEPTPRPIPRPR